MDSGCKWCPLPGRSRRCLRTLSGSGGDRSPRSSKRPRRCWSRDSACTLFPHRARCPARHMRPVSSRCTCRPGRSRRRSGAAGTGSVSRWFPHPPRCPARRRPPASSRCRCRPGRSRRPSGAAGRDSACRLSPHRARCPARRMRLGRHGARAGRGAAGARRLRAGIRRAGGSRTLPGVGRGACRLCRHGAGAGRGAAGAGRSADRGSASRWSPHPARCPARHMPPVSSRCRCRPGRSRRRSGLRARVGRAGRSGPLPGVGRGTRRLCRHGARAGRSAAGAGRLRTGVGRAGRSRTLPGAGRGACRLSRHGAGAGRGAAGAGRLRTGVRRAGRSRTLPGARARHMPPVSSRCRCRPERSRRRSAADRGSASRWFPHPARCWGEPHAACVVTVQVPAGAQQAPVGGCATGIRRAGGSRTLPGAGRGACRLCRHGAGAGRSAAGAGRGLRQGFGEQVVAAPCQVLGEAHAACVVTVQVPAGAQQAPVGGCVHGLGVQVVLSPSYVPPAAVHAAAVRI